MIFFGISEAKYPQLCELCSSTTSQCEYGFSDGSRHQKALRCMLNKGQVSYVAKSEVQAFFSAVSYFIVVEKEKICKSLLF